MTDAEIQTALVRVRGESDPSTKHQLLASLVAAVFHERGVELAVVGGSAIEFYTEGAYASGDLDLCLVSHRSLDVRSRAELMGRLGGEGGPRNWKVAGTFVDILGELETAARTPLRRVRGPFGDYLVIQPEDLLVERVLVSVYPQPHAPARETARKLLAVALRRGVELDWQEVERVARLPAYDNFEHVAKLTREVAHELRTPSPLDPA